MKFNWMTGWRLMMFFIVTVVSCFVIIGSAVSQVVPDKSGTELAARSVASGGQPPESDSAVIARQDEKIRRLQQDMQQCDSSLHISLEAWRQALTSNLQIVQNNLKSEAALHREQLEKELRKLQEQLKTQNDEQENKWQTYKNNLTHYEKIVDWGLTLAAILLAVFGLVGIIVPLLLFREAKTAHKEVKDLLQNTKAEVRERLQDTKAEVKEFEGRVRLELELIEKQAQTHLYEIEKNRDASSRILNKMSSETVSKNPDKSKVNAEKVIANPAASAKEKDFAEAYKLQASKNLSAAITQWQKIINTLALNKGEMTAVYHNLGYLFHEQKKWDEAIENYCAALALNPNDSSILNNRGVAYFWRGKPEDRDLALADYTKALELNPVLPDAWNNRGLAYYSRGNSGDFDLALADYTKALELNPASPNTWSNRGLAYVRRNNPGDFDLALADYTKALELNPASPDTWSNRGLAYYSRGNSGDFDLALADYTKALELNPALPDAWSNRGLAYYSRGNPGDFDLALADYTKALELNPALPDAWSNRGLAYYSRGNPGDFDLALADYTKALELNPRDAGKYLNCLELMLIAGWLNKFDELLKNFRLAVPEDKLDPKDRIILQILLIMHLIIIGEPDQEQQTKLCEMLKIPEKLNWSFREINAWLATPNKLTEMQRAKIQKLLDKVREANLI